MPNFLKVKCQNLKWHTTSKPPWNIKKAAQHLWCNACHLKLTWSPFDDVSEFAAVSGLRGLWHCAHGSHLPSQESRYVWHAEVEIRLSFTYTAHCKSLQLSTTSHQPELSEMQYSYIALTWPHYVTCLIQKVASSHQLRQAKFGFQSNSGNVVGHSMNAEYPLTVLHSTCCSLTHLHRPQERAATMWPYFFRTTAKLCGRAGKCSAGRGHAVSSQIKWNCFNMGV